MNVVIRFFMAASLLGVLVPSLASAEADTAMFVDLDNRLAAPGKKGTAANEIQRLEYTAGVATYYGAESWGVMGDLKLIASGTPDSSKVGAFLREPNRFNAELDALYVEFFDLVEGVDVRVGRQIVEWGSADMFNPTNTVNALDLEDPLKFGKRIPNEMASITWNAPWMVESAEGDLVFDELSVTFLAVPVYRRSLLPRTANAAFTDPELIDLQVSSGTLKLMSGLNDFFVQDKHGTVTYNLQEEEREFSLERVQLGGVVALNLLGVNISAMYYKGFSDIVYADDISIDLHHDDADKQRAAENTMDGLDLSDPTTVRNIQENELVSEEIPENLRVRTNVTLKNPAIHMLGAAMSTSLDSLGGVGIWAEAAYFFHEDLKRHIQAGSEAVVEDVDLKNSFLKLTLGMDYTIARWWYVNVQYMYGFVDEFGSQRLNNYVVGVNDFKLFADKLLIRVVVMNQLEDQSMVVFPQLVSTYWQNVELTVGAMAYLGDKLTKFGSPAAGPNLVIGKAKFSL